MSTEPRDYRPLIDWRPSRIRPEPTLPWWRRPVLVSPFWFWWGIVFCIVPTVARGWSLIFSWIFGEPLH